MKAMFRVDASFSIGSGHVMRCLCLAEVLRDSGVDCHFLTRELPGNLIDQIGTLGFDCHVLSPPQGTLDPSGTYADWLGVTQDADMQEVAPILAEARADWLIVDHYALDASWEQGVRPAGARVLVIDDLANRPHDCDILLDTGIDRHPADYSSRIPAECRLLLGPLYALLRPEFAALRPQALQRKRAWPLGNILISMGGVDPQNATLQVLMTLERADLPGQPEVHVVLGRQAPNLEIVRTYARQSGLTVFVHAGIANMGERMLAADLGIGASGTTFWERCSVGLPALILVIAENQIPNADALTATGSARLIGMLWEPDWEDRLLKALADLSGADTLAMMARCALAVTDAKGTERVVREMTSPELTVRPCNDADAEQVWHWREADGAPRFYRSGRATPWPDHAAWFARTVSDPDRMLLMIEEAGQGVAHVRFDRHDLGRADISICLLPSLRGHGLGARVLERACQYAADMGLAEIVAEVHVEDYASRAVFENRGFVYRGQDGAFLQFLRHLAKGAQKP